MFIKNKIYTGISKKTSLSISSSGMYYCHGSQHKCNNVDNVWVMTMSKRRGQDTGHACTESINRPFQQANDSSCVIHKYTPVTPNLPKSGIQQVSRSIHKDRFPGTVA